jgi:hypothetical protein
MPIIPKNLFYFLSIASSINFEIIEAEFSAASIPQLFLKSHLFLGLLIIAQPLDGLALI